VGAILDKIFTETISGQLAKLVIISGSAYLGGLLLAHKCGHTIKKSDTAILAALFSLDMLGRSFQVLGLR
jgi:hypothetical protein